MSKFQEALKQKIEDIYEGSEMHLGTNLSNVGNFAREYTLKEFEEVVEAFKKLVDACSNHRVVKLDYASEQSCRELIQKWEAIKAGVK